MSQSQGWLVAMVRGAALFLAVLLAGQLLWPLVAGSEEDTLVDSAFEPRVVRIGDTLADLPVTVIPEAGTADLSRVPLSSLVAGSPEPCTVLIVYSVTCGACRRAAKAWKDAAPVVRDRLAPAVRWVSLPDGEDRIRAFHEEFGLAAPGYRLGSGAAAQALGVIGTPTIYAVDRGLRVVRMPGASPEELMRGESTVRGETLCSAGAT